MGFSGLLKNLALDAVLRGADEASGSLFSYVDLEARIPAWHPLRKIRQVVNDALASLDGEFEALYTDFGRPSIPPERLIRASLIQILFSIRSERQLMEQMQYNLLFRWFVGLGIDDAVWVPTVFTKNRDRLLTTEMSRKVMAAILAHREVALPAPPSVPVSQSMMPFCRCSPNRSAKPWTPPTRASTRWERKPRGSLTMMSNVSWARPTNA